MRKLHHALFEHWLDYTVWTIALWASFLNLLSFHHYPLVRAEVSITLLGLALLGTVLGAMQHAARPRLSFVVAGLFLAVMIDLNAPVERVWFFVIWVGLSVAAYFALDAVIKIAFAAFMAVLLFPVAESAIGVGAPARDRNMVENRQVPGRPVADRPAIIHVVLDSHLGLDGFALGPDAYGTLNADLAAFFTDQGFQYYPRAYSRHSRTADSIPYAFSYGDNPPALQWVNSDHAVPGKLPYFSDLDARGYRISASAPVYLDMCVNQPMTVCRNWEPSELTSMLGTQLGPVDRAKIFAFTLLELATMPSQVVEAAQLSVQDMLGTQGRKTTDRSQLPALASIRRMDSFTDDLAGLQRGEVRYLHLLLPHSPFALNADCSVKPEAAWLDEHHGASEADREMAYADQVRCLQHRLGRMIGVLNGTPAGRGAIVLIHGDHGSRIAPSHPFWDRPALSPRQMLMVHSTLFAIRVPAETAGEVPGTYALDELIADFRARDFASAPRPERAPAQVVIAGVARPGRVLRPLPDFDR